MSKTFQNLKSCGAEFFVAYYPEVLRHYPQIFKKETQKKERARIFAQIISEHQDSWWSNKNEEMTVETWKRNLRAVLDIIRENCVEEALEIIVESNPKKVDEYFINLAKKELEEIKTGKMELPSKYDNSMDE